MTTPDDTYALQQAIDAAGSGCLRLPQGDHYISAPLVSTCPGFSLRGEGLVSTFLRAVGDFDAVLRIEGNYSTVAHLGIVTDGTQTRCLDIAQDAVVPRASAVYFSGDLAGDLVYSNGHNLDFDRVTWQVSSPLTYALNLDSFNQNTGVIDSRIGGPGKGLRVTNAFSPANRVEGLKVRHNHFINTGDSNIELGSSLFTTIGGNVLDQSSARALAILKGADNVLANHNYFGANPASSAGSTGIYLAPDAGKGHGIDGNAFNGLGYGIFADASATHRITSLGINSNKFNSTHNALILDSVARCVLTGNIDSGTPANGSLNIKGTYGPGDYRGGNNCWGPGASALWHAGSTYNFVNDTRG